jgi:riboflavin synthase alpha subunit
MKLALHLAQRGLGRVAPNPAVGCVLVAPESGRIIARGWTQPSGRPHAEVHALNKLGGKAKGATAYVTLEPCAHHGKTPPCAEALIEAGVTRVVSAMTDPDPRVSGKGHEMLRKAGIEVVEGVLEEEAYHLNEGFILKVREGRPLVMLKLASSLDGRTATHSGESQWITGEAARNRGHLMRAEADAIMIGSATAIVDDPTLTCRLSRLRRGHHRGAAGAGRAHGYESRLAGNRRAGHYPAHGGRRLAACFFTGAGRACGPDRLVSGAQAHRRGRVSRAGGARRSKDGRGAGAGAAPGIGAGRGFAAALQFPPAGVGMFTGIITDIGRLRSMEKTGDTRLVIETAYDAAGIELGASIACDGACLTVVERGVENGQNWFAVEASQETLDCTALGTWKEGQRINLERALKVGDELGGHIVSGHVDGVGKILDIRPEGDSMRFTFEAPEDLKKFIAEKGSVTLNGTSLTVNEVEGNRFGVNIIPHTQAVTTWGTAKAGDAVNLEIDMLARYVARLRQED